MKGLKIITAIEILSKVKISAELFPAFFKLRKVANQIYEERNIAIDKFRADWGDEIKSVEEARKSGRTDVDFSPALKEADEAVTRILDEINSRDYEVEKFNLTSEAVIEALKDSNLTFEQVAVVADVLCNED